MSNATTSAFPVSKRFTEKYMDAGGYGRERVVNGPLTGGLTKREYIAALAMQGLCADSMFDADIAVNAVRMADRLLAELARTQEQEQKS